MYAKAPRIVASKNPITEELEGSTTLLEEELERLRRELLALMDKIGLDPSDDLYFHLRAFGWDGGAILHKDADDKTLSKAKISAKQEKERQKIAERDGRVICAYERLKEPHTDMCAEEMLYWQQEIDRLKRKHKKPYGQQYYVALELHREWLKAQSWEEFSQIKLMKGQDKAFVRAAKQDWGLPLIRQSNPSLDGSKELRRHLEKLKPKTVMGLLGKFSDATSTTKEQTLANWRFRWESLGYFPDLRDLVS